MQDRMQPQRFELKYLISGQKALALRDFTRSYLEIDEYGELMPNFSYPVHSLYLDSSELGLYQEVINGTRNRYKLRLRYYDDRPESPVFFEIKRRRNNTIYKQRGSVKRMAVAKILSGQLPEAHDLVSQEPRYLVAVQRFCYLMQQVQASPRAHVTYMREAWISRRDNSVRLTIDRGVVCGPELEAGLSARAPVVPPVFGKLVVLELKFTDRFPLWFQELVERFSLVQTGASKYVDGISLLGTSRFTMREVCVAETGGRRRPVNGHLRPLPEGAEAELRLNQEVY